MLWDHQSPTDNDHVTEEDSWEHRPSEGFYLEPIARKGHDGF